MGRVEEENMPPPVPQPLVMWCRTDVEGNSAFFAINKNPDEIDDICYMPPDEFIMTFPGLVGLDSSLTIYTDTSQTASTLNFITVNLTTSFVSYDYRNLRIAFGWWECIMLNWDHIW